MAQVCVRCNIATIHRNWPQCSTGLDVEIVRVVFACVGNGRIESESSGSSCDDQETFGEHVLG